MMMGNHKARKVLKELYIGIAMYAFIFAIIGIIFMRPIWMYLLSLAVGALGAGLQAYSIYDTLDITLDLSEKKAKSFAMLRSMSRLIICLVLMVVAVLIHWTAFVGVTIGLLGLKISAFINPIVKKITTKIDGVEDTLDIEQK